MKFILTNYSKIHHWDMRSSQSSKADLMVQNLHVKDGVLFGNFVKSVFVPVVVICSLSILFLFVFIFANCHSQSKLDDTACKITLVESIPENLTFPDSSPVFPSTYYAWKTLLNDARKSIDLAVFYWSMKNEDVTPIKMPSAWQGEDIFQELLNIGKENDVKIRVAQNAPTARFPQKNSEVLAQEGAAEVRSLNFDQLVGAGVLHTKMWIIDGAHLYLGSANMDWESLTQVKEVGVLIQNCSCLAQDLLKVFEVYWILGNASGIPPHWPQHLETKFNIENPMTLSISNQNASVFISSSPLPFNPLGRTNDIDAILSIIRSADKFIHIAVMDYFPRMLYSKGNIFWPVIDVELRRAAVERRVEVRLLASLWNHTRADMVAWLLSLQDISGHGVSVQTKLFVVPSFTEHQRELRFARVNHNKYMVTDKTAYVGTSNWSGDYFTTTAGASLSVSEEGEESEGGASFRDQLESVFRRDWSSAYATPPRRPGSHQPATEQRRQPATSRGFA